MITSSAVTERINRMEAEDLVEHVRDGNDRL
jgi:DNA-binding MarR family transcriptional regulator